MTTRYLLVASILASWSQSSDAALVHNIFQVGDEIVSTLRGTANVTALTLDTQFAGTTPRINPFGASYTVGDPSASDLSDFYAPIQGPTRIFDPPIASVINASISAPTGGFGPRSGVVGGTLSAIAVPPDYVSGEPILAETRWAVDDIAGLPITPATYVWTWGSGDIFDSYTLNFGVPEPASALLAFISLLCVDGRLSRRR